MTSFWQSLRGFTRIFGGSRRRERDLAVAGGPTVDVGSRPVRVRNRRDKEFLPAALEIIETPPSPIFMALLAAICLLFATSLTWAYVGRLDIVAVASGKIQPQGRVKTIQPVQTGRVASIAVSNGMHVAAGDVLLTLDPAASDAEQKELKTNLASYRAEVIRRGAATAAAHGAKTPTIDWPEGTPAALAAREDAVLGSDLTQLRSDVANLRAQEAQKQAERRRLDETIMAQSALVDTLKERVDMRTTLMQSGSGPKAAVIDAKEAYQTQGATLAYQVGQRAENDAAIAEIESRIAKAYDAFLADNEEKRAEAERQADDYAGRLAKARVSAAQLTITSPIAGVVQGSVVTTVGQVLTVGEEIMRIVPDSTRLEIEAYLPNKDIGFVQTGQEAVVKVESFPFTRYGTLRGSVVRVATDAIPEPEANMAEALPTHASQDTSVGGGQHTRDLVFPITIAIDADSIEADGRQVPLSAGMAVTVEVKTGTRRMLDYLFSPVLEVTSTSMHER